MPAGKAHRLDHLRPGGTAVIEDLAFGESDRVRLMELGFIPGASVACQRMVPLGDLAIYQIEGTQIALRRETAARIMLQPGVVRGQPDATRQ